MNPKYFKQFVLLYDPFLYKIGTFIMYIYHVLKLKLLLLLRRKCLYKQLTKERSQIKVVLQILQKLPKLKYIL